MQFGRQSSPPPSLSLCLAFRCSSEPPPHLTTMADLSPPPTEAAAVSVPFFKKKARPRPTARQRSPSPSSSSTATTAAAAAASSSASAAVGGPSSTASTSAVLKPSRKTAFNPLVQGTHKRKSRYANGDDDDAAADDEFDGAGDSSAVGVTWQTSGSAKANNTNFVTGGLDWDADAVEDEEKRKRQRLVDVRPSPFPFSLSLSLSRPTSSAIDLLPCVIDGLTDPLLSQAALNDGLPSDGLYHGAAAYSSHLAPARDSAVSNKMKAGPQKASSNIRQITVIDYQPDVCKDYKGAFPLPSPLPFPYPPALASYYGRSGQKSV